MEDGARRGVRLTFDDKGPGITDIEQALKDGYTTGGGLGLGLGGARRLSNEFSIDSRPAQPSLSMPTRNSCLGVKSIIAVLSVVSGQFPRSACGTYFGSFCSA